MHCEVKFLGLCLAISIYLHPVLGGAGNLWTYNGTLGPSHWHVDYPDCGGKKQSPINIVVSNVKYDPDLDEFDLGALDLTNGVDMQLENVAGHTVEVTLSGSTTLEVTGGGLENSYIVKQFHFHWGREDERGSEHDINSERFPMEMHIVLYSTKYTDFSEAVDKPKGLAVLAFLFQVGENNPNFDPLLDHFTQIQHSGNETEIETFKVSSLLPNDTSSYFRYDGSLTTPPCYESVVWSVFTERITVAEAQLEKFRHIKRIRDGNVEEDLVDDFRPLQSINNRMVYTNFKVISGVTMVAPSLIILFTAMCALVVLKV